jgi:hypothetical protein
MIRFIFDMDGTIVDSYLAVRAAYKKAGLALPEDAWGKTAAEWDCPQAVHEMKKRLYPTILRSHGRRLHAADLLEIVHGHVLTGASIEAVDAVRKFLGFKFDVVGHSCNQDRKINILRQLSREHKIIYVDDDLAFGKRALDEVDNLVFMAVARHEGVYHLHKKGAVQRWTLSSWLPDVTIV